MASLMERMPSQAADVVETALFDDLDGVARDAGGALDRRVQRSMYDRLDWLRLTQTHVLPDTRLMVVRARLRDAGAWLFLRDHGSGRAGAFAGWYTLNVAPVFTPDLTDAARMRLLRGLASAVRGLSRIDLEPMDGATAFWLQEAFRSVGWRTAEEDATVTWTVPVRNRGFDDYWADRPSRLRNTVRRRQKNSDLTIRILDRFDPHAWTAYEEVYAGSWKPVEGSPAFLRDLARIEGEAGSLRLGLAFRGERPVASQFWTVENEVATIHKLAYLETERAASPGTLLSHAMFRHVMTHDRPAVIDYGNGDDAYKADWMTERRVLKRLTLFNTRTLGGLAGAIARSVRHG